MEIKIERDYIPVGHPNRPGRKLKKVLGIVFHWTANLRSGANVDNHIRYVGRAYKKVNGKNKESNGSNFRYGATQFFVDSEKIGSPIPENEVAYHVGSPNYTDLKKRLVGNENPNNYFIGIEGCVNADGDFFKMLNNSITLIYYLMEKYDLSVKDVYRHHDITGKYCPMYMINKKSADNYGLPYITFDDFKDMIIDESNKFDEEPPKKEMNDMAFVTQSKLAILKIIDLDDSIKKFEEILGVTQDGKWDPFLDKVFEQISNKPTLKLYNKASKLYPHVVKYVQYRVGCDQIDGWYGPNTIARVKMYQIKNSLTSDGFVGPKTWRSLIG